MAEIAKGRIQFDGVWRVQNWLSLNTWVVARSTEKNTGARITRSVEMVTVDPARPSSPVRVFEIEAEAIAAAAAANKKSMLSSTSSKEIVA